MAQGRFSAQVAAAVAKNKKLMTAVYRESAQRVIEIMQEPGPSVSSTKIASAKSYGPVHSGGAGHLPVVTGFLRASLQTVIGDALFTLRDNPNPEGQFSFDLSEVSLVIAGAQVSDTITAAYTARYAKAMENRYAFVRLAAQQWQRVVPEVATEAQARMTK